MKGIYIPEYRKNMSFKFRRSRLLEEPRRVIVFQYNGCWYHDLWSVSTLFNEIIWHSYLELILVRGHTMFCWCNIPNVDSDSVRRKRSLWMVHPCHTAYFWLSELYKYVSTKMETWAFLLNLQLLMTPNCLKQMQLLNIYTCLQNGTTLFWFL